ncbi:hypothetical protein AB669_11480 [Pedobacter sp. BMA]|nr:hypothetical protein AB669_11480 [Pedobacter sp. BMA]
MQASQTKTAVEIPNSGSASLKEEKRATADIADAKRYGSNFFIFIISVVKYPKSKTCPFFNKNSMKH